MKNDEYKKLLLKKDHIKKAVEAWESFYEKQAEDINFRASLSETDKDAECDGYDLDLYYEKWSTLALGFLIGQGLTVKEACALTIGDTLSL